MLLAANGVQLIVCAGECATLYSFIATCRSGCVHMRFISISKYINNYRASHNISPEWQEAIDLGACVRAEEGRNYYYFNAQNSRTCRPKGTFETFSVRFLMSTKLKRRRTLFLQSACNWYRCNLPDLQSRHAAYISPYQTFYKFVYNLKCIIKQDLVYIFLWGACLTK